MYILMLKFKKIFAVSFILFVSLLTMAQTKTKDVIAKGDTTANKKMVVKATSKVAPTSLAKKHEMSFYAGYGLSAGKFKPTFGGSDNGGGLLFGTDYIFTFRKHWAITTGLDFSSYTSKFVAQSAHTVNPEVDSQGEAFFLHANYSGWVEKQKLFTLGIPVTIRFKTAFSPKWDFFVGTGVRLALATGGYSEVTGGDVKLSAYYPRLNIWYEDLQYQGFVNQEFREKKHTQTKTNISSVSDLGFTLHINPQWSLYAAVYFEYGFLNLKKGGKDEPLIAYNGQNNTPYYNFVPYSNTIDKANTIAVGGKLGLLYTFGASKVKASVKPVVNAKSAKPSSGKASSASKTKSIPKETLK